MRTPLANISWEISKENKESIDLSNIQEQVLRISNILEGLNLTISLANIDKKALVKKIP